MSNSLIGLSEASIARLKDRIGFVSDDAVAAIIEEVPEYADALSGPMGATIREAVRVALSAFVTVASTSTGEAGPPRAAALQGAYDLGRGEARGGRSADALLQAFRIGARVSWEGMAAQIVQTGAGAGAVANFATLVFDYIDQLSGASVAGHADEVAKSGQVRERLLERLARDLLEGKVTPSLLERASAVGWSPPTSLTVVLIPEAYAREVSSIASGQVLSTRADRVEDHAILLVPDAHGRQRASLVRLLRTRGGVAGPPRPWEEIRSSYERALRVLELGLGPDSEEHLGTVVLAADEGALDDLRRRVLAPLDELTDASRAKLVETLRVWLLFQGRRDDMAKELFVHPQTIRYRMTQLRELYGERLDDPAWILDLTIALGSQPAQ